MQKQKICVIGGNLTGLVTAISLSKLNCEIDLITDSIDQNFRSNRTIAISENNFHFLKKLNISKFLEDEIWSCSVMKLYTEIKNNNFSKIFELNSENKKKKILYILENSKIVKFMLSNIKETKSISLIKNKKVSSISNSGLLKKVKLNNYSSKYNLVIICTGYNSSLAEKIFDDQIIKNSYQELAITAILNHNSVKNNIARQIFLENEILALLPISNTQTSIVWSVNKSIQKRGVSFIKKKIKFYVKNYLEKISFATHIEYKNLNFLIRNKYYTDRILLFGDALHVIHPFVGQGFNMTLRDLECLEKILRKKIDLGLDIGSLDILSEFSNETKPRNFAFSIGTNILKNSLSFKRVRNNMLRILNKNDFVKNIFFDIADRGFRF